MLPADDWLQNRVFGPCRPRGLPTIDRVLYQPQGWRETLSSGGKRCPLWGVGAAFSGHKRNQSVLGGGDPNSFMQLKWDFPRKCFSNIFEKAPASCRAISGPSGPKSQKSQKRVKNESKKSLPGPPVPGVQRVRKESKTSQKRVIFDSFLQPLFSKHTIPTEIFTRQIRQNLKSVTVKITNPPKNPFDF